MPLLVRDLMTDDPISLGPEATLDDLREIMEAKGVRHVPVVDGEDTLLGLVSHRDLVSGALYGEGEVPFSTLRHMLRTRRVAEIMSTGPVTVASDDPIQVAGELMSENKFGCVPVVDNDALVGILTESDFVRYVMDSSR